MLKGEHSTDYLKEEGIISEVAEQIQEEQDKYLFNITKSKICSSNLIRDIRSNSEASSHQRKRSDNDPQASSSCQVSGRQQSTNYNKVHGRLEEFVEYFVKEFEAKLHAYYMILEGEVKKAGKFSDKFSRNIGKVTGGVIGGGFGLLLAPFIGLAALRAGIKGGTALGEEGIGALGDKLGERHYIKKVISLSELVYYAKENKGNMRKILVENGFDIFQSFEMQFMRVTTDQGHKEAMRKLAEDATNRAISYIQKKNALITEGVVLGESKIEPVLGVPIASSKFKTPGFKINYKYKSSEKKWSTASLYGKVGLIIEGKASREITRYYKKKDGKSKIDKYGYRRLFTSEGWDKLKDEYDSDNIVESKSEFTDYQYAVSPRSLEEQSRNILDKLNSKDINLGEDRIKNILEEVKKDILDEIVGLKKQSHIYIEDHNTLITSIETNLKNFKTNKYLERFKQYFEKAEQERQKIAKSIEASREENRENFNQLSQKQDIHHDDSKREHKKTQAGVERLEKGMESDSKKINEIHEVVVAQENEQTKESIRFNMIEPVKSFTGRDKKSGKDELGRLHKALQSESGQVAVSQVVCISGLGGIGKTELARKYACNHVKDYDSNAIWINSETQESLKESFQGLAGMLKIPILKNLTGEIDMNSTTQSIYKYFKNIKSLFIFDNAEEYKDIKEYLPCSLPYTNKKPHILITSRNRDWEVGEEGKIEVVLLDEFHPDEAAEFIKTALNIKVKDNDEEIKQLAKELQCFPLALQQATAYIKERSAILETRGSKKFEVNDYLTEYKEVKTDLLNFKPKHGNNRYIETVLTTWKITLKNIKQKGDSGEQALRIMNIMSYLAPDKVPIKKIFLKLVENEEQMWSAVELLNKYSMINLKEGISNIHRLVQEVIRFELKDKEEQVLRKALKIINSSNLAEDTSHVTSIWNYASKYDQLINEFYHFYGKDENTPLHLLATSGNKEAIDRILTSMQVTIEKFKKMNVLDESSNWIEKRKNQYNKVGYAPIHSAAVNGHEEIVKYFIEEQKVDAKLITDNTVAQTPMMLATLCDHLNVVRYLVESKKDTDVNIPNKLDMYPIHSATTHGSLDLVQFLINNGANNLDVLLLGCTPLHLTLNKLHGYKDNYEVVDILLDKDPTLINFHKTGYTALHRAVTEGYPKSTETLLRRGAKVDVKTNKILFRAKNHNTGKFIWLTNNYEPELTPLHIAVQQDFLVIAKLLLKYGAIYNDVNIEGKTPLQIAKPGSDVEKLLNIINKLFQAVKNGKEDEVCSLLQRKTRGELEAVLNAKNTDNKKFSFLVGRIKSETLLHIAAQQDFLKIAKLLLKYGAIYNAINEQRNTPSNIAEPESDIEKLLNSIADLFEAVRDGKIDVVNSLLEGKDSDTLKAVLSARNTDSKTLVQIACIEYKNTKDIKYKSIAELLKEKLSVLSSDQQQETICSEHNILEVNSIKSNK